MLFQIFILVGAFLGGALRSAAGGHSVVMMRFGFGRFDSINSEQVTIYYAHW